MSRVLIDNELWKSVENVSTLSIARFSAGQPPDGGIYRGTDASGPPLGACSACSGDYEDPDRTAWPPAPEEADEDAPYGTSDLLRDEAQTSVEDERNTIKFPDARG
jgi:hypothetical protein